MTGLKSVVFVAAGAGTETKFLGVGQPSTVRWAVARAQPWLEVAFAQAYQNALINAVQPPVEDEHGRMDPNLAETVVSFFISQITPPIAIPPAYPVPYPPPYPPPVAGGPPAAFGYPQDWVNLGNSQEHASWITMRWFDETLKDLLWRDAVLAADNQRAEIRSLVECSAPFVARVKSNGEFISLVDRVTFLDELAKKITQNGAAP